MFPNKDFTSKFFSLYFIDLLSKFFLIIDADISLLEWFIFSIVDFLKVDFDKLQRLLSIKIYFLHVYVKVGMLLSNDSHYYLFFTFFGAIN